MTTSYAKTKNSAQTCLQRKKAGSLNVPKVKSRVNEQISCFYDAPNESSGFFPSRFGLV